MGKEEKPVEDGVHAIILGDLQYIRGKLDVMSEIVSSDHTRLDDHLSNHRQGPDKVMAVASIFSVLVAIVALYYATNTTRNDEESNYNNMDRRSNNGMYEYIQPK